MIAWGSPTAAPLTPTDHAQVEAALAGYSWVRAFPGAVVLTINDANDRSAVQQRLVAASQALGGRVHILISPAMQGGSGNYLGFLASTIWDPLNSKAL
jgi:hypothetical protein